MSGEEQRRIFSQNLRALLSENNMKQIEVSDAIGVMHQTFNTWTQGKAIPRMDKIQALADYFHIPKSRLLEKWNSPSPVEVPSLSPAEDRLLQNYRILDSEDRQQVDMIIDTFVSKDKYKKDAVGHTA